MIATKRCWRTLELVVLARSRPEEAVLGGCKSGLQAGAGNTQSACRVHPASGACTARPCSTIATS